MKLIFTRSHSLLSRMIRFMTGEPVSHVAFVCGDFILHSTLWGPEIRTLKWAQEHYEIVFEVDTHSPKDRLLDVMTRADGEGYDFLGLLYLGARYAMKKYLRISLPKVNLWDVSGMYTCVEFATLVVDKYSNPMLTPYGLYLRLSKP